MTSSDTLILALRLIEGGEVDRAVLDWLRDGFTDWRRFGGDLLDHLNLPPAHTFALAGRDLWLRDAATYCAGATAWARAVDLERHIARFRAVRWPAWRKLASVPSGATQIEACLFLAHRCTENMPKRRALYRVVEGVADDTKSLVELGDRVNNGEQDADATAELGAIADY